MAVEIIGRAGFDFLLIDGEHSPFNETGLRDAMIACDNTPAETVVRVRANEEPRIKLAAPIFPFLSDYQRTWTIDLAVDAYAELREWFRWFDPRHEREWQPLAFPD